MTCVLCRLPEIPTPDAGEIMVKGILEEQQMFSVPGYMYMMNEFIRFVKELRLKSNNLNCPEGRREKKRLYDFILFQVVTLQFAKVVQRHKLRRNPAG